LPVSEISREQEYVASLYERVDALREQASARLARALREDGGTAQSRLDRDAAIAHHTGQLARLDAAESGLCFGRLDLRSGECLHIGRIGLRDESPLMSPPWASRSCSTGAPQRPAPSTWPPRARRRASVAAVTSPCAAAG
jgi:hypothetical protein